MCLFLFTKLILLIEIQTLCVRSSLLQRKSMQVWTGWGKRKLVCRRHCEKIAALTRRLQLSYLWYSTTDSWFSVTYLILHSCLLSLPVTGFDEASGQQMKQSSFESFLAMPWQEEVDFGTPGSPARATIAYAVARARCLSSTILAPVGAIFAFFSCRTRTASRGRIGSSCS